MNDKVSVQGVFEEIQQGSMSSEYASPALSSRDSFVISRQLCLGLARQINQGQAVWLPKNETERLL